nr:MFS transporter [Secundilactobacillus odoratitofui]
MGIYGLASALGMAVGPALSVYLYQHYSYQRVFLVAATFSVLMLIVIQFVGNHGIPDTTQVKKYNNATKISVGSTESRPISGDFDVDFITILCHRILHRQLHRSPTF